MIESNYKQATRIIQKTERITNLPVRVSWDETLPVGSILHLSEMDWAKQLRISVNPNRPDIPYLVASQCGVALRFLKQKENKHLNSKKGSIEKTITETFARSQKNSHKNEIIEHRKSSELGN